MPWVKPDGGQERRGGKAVEQLRSVIKGAVWGEGEGLEGGIAIVYVDVFRAVI